MTVTIPPENLHRELAIRGLSQSAFSRICQVSEPTLSRVSTGRAISPATLQKMVAALAACPPLPGADALLGNGDGH